MSHLWATVGYVLIYWVYIDEKLVHVWEIGEIG